MFLAIPILIVAAILLAMALVVAVVIAAVAVFAVFGAGCSVLLGGFTALFRPTRVAAPFFLFVVPMTVMGGVLGFFVVGAIIIASSSGVMLVVGPLIGLVAGITIGGAVGTGLAAITWILMWNRRRSVVPLPPRAIA